MDNSLFALGESRLLQNKLIVTEKLPVAYAAILAYEALHQFDPRVLEGVRLWMNDQLTPEFSVEDASVAEIEENFGLTGFKALALMDIYLKDPDFVVNDVQWFERRYS